MHERVEEAKTAVMDLGPMEDADSIQMGIRKLQGAILEGKLNHRQIAAAGVHDPTGSMECDEDERDGEGNKPTTEARDTEEPERDKAYR